MFYDKKILIDTENLIFQIDGEDISQTEEIDITISARCREISVVYHPRTVAMAKISHE